VDVVATTIGDSFEMNHIRIDELPHDLPDLLSCMTYSIAGTPSLNGPLIDVSPRKTFRAALIKLGQLLDSRISFLC